MQPRGTRPQAPPSRWPRRAAAWDTWLGLGLELGLGLGLGVGVGFGLGLGLGVGFGLPMAYGLRRKAPALSPGDAKTDELPLT